MPKKGLMNNPIRIISDLKMFRQGRLARIMCRLRKHRVVKSGGSAGTTWSCARAGCNWTRRK